MTTSIAAETAEIQAFREAYWASQPPELRDFRNLDSDKVNAYQRAFELSKRGFTVDVPIMVWGWDPYRVMKVRLDYGYTWMPSALQEPIVVAPGLVVPGIPTYDPKNAPLGSIKVSVNIADYPPFEPLPQPAKAVVNPVGSWARANLYNSGPGDNFPNGAEYADSRGKFVKHVDQSPFGGKGWHYWERVGPQ